MASIGSTSTPARARRFGVALAALCVLGLASQALILSQTLAHDPFGMTPVNDAQDYWLSAGEIARGRLLFPTPFLWAPLYPYLLGLVRALGGGLASVYALQAVLHVATAVLVHRIGARRLRPQLALLAAALYLVLADPAYFTGRVLACTLQAFLTAALCERLLALQDRPHVGRALAAGALLGLDVLANPSFLLALPIVAAWAATLVPSARGRWRIGAATLASALLVISPATLHNALAAHEFIPVSAQGGLTFHHGNAPGADGTYRAAQGVSTAGFKQGIDALAAGGDGGYGAASSAWFAKGLAWWRSDPLAALALAARKLHWFHTARNYGDVYLPAFEIEDGFASRLRLAPVPVAWVALPALLCALGRVRAPRRNLPQLLLHLVPLATVVVFWYSPRYRLPAVPVMCVSAASSLAAVLAWRAAPWRAGAHAAAWVAAFASGPIDRRLGFDTIEQYRAAYEQALGNVLVEQGRLEEALAHYRRALEAGEPNAGASIGDVLRRLGQGAQSIEALSASVKARPNSAYAQRSLAVALAQAERFEEARARFEAALRIDPNDWEALSGAGNVALALGAVDDAIASYRAALKLNPRFASAHYNLGWALETLGREGEAEAEFREALATQPALAPASERLSALLCARGDFTQALAVLRAGTRNAPHDAALARALAWLLATAPEARMRDGSSALELAQKLAHASGGRDPAVLDTLAAAQAETGLFDEAVASVSRALELAHAPESAEYHAQLEQRLALYRRRQPFRQTPP